MAARSHGSHGTHSEGASPTTHTHGGGEDEGGSPAVRAHGGGTGSVAQLTASVKAKFAAGKAGTSAVLANADDFTAAKHGTGEMPGEAVLYLKSRPDFHAADFHRKARDLERLGDEGALIKTKSPERATVQHKGPKPKKKLLTSVYRERIVRRLTKNDAMYQANKSLATKLYRGMGGNKAGEHGITKVGEAVDPDHIQDLQLKGDDAIPNFRLMDAWTNRQMGSDISNALRNVPLGTKVIVRLIP